MTRWLPLVLLSLGCGGGSTATTTSEADSANVETDTGTTPVDTGFDDSVLEAETSAPIDLSAPGPNAVEVSDATVEGRAVHLLAPKTAAPPEGLPAVVFAHGFLLKPGDYDQLLNAVAAWGFVVLSVDYPGSLFSVDHREVQNAIVWGRAALAAGKIPKAPKVAGDKVVAAGHSLGGKGAIMAILADKALRGALAIDPVDGNPSPLGMTPSPTAPKLAPTETAKIAVPVGYFGATQSRCVKPPMFPGAPAQACAPETLDAATLYAGTSGTKYLWTLFDFGHMQFLDNAMCGTTCDACVTGKGDVLLRKRTTTTLMVAFLRHHLAGDAAAKRYLDGEEHAKLVAGKQLWDGKTDRPACP